MSRFLRIISSGFASKLFLLLTDVAGLLLLFNLVHMVRMDSVIPIGNGPIWAIVLITVVTLYIMDVYRTEMPITRARLPLQTFLAVPVAAVLTALFVYALGVNSFLSIFGRGVMPIAFFLFSLWAASFRWLLTYINQRYGDKLHWFLLMEPQMGMQLQEDLSSKSGSPSTMLEVQAGGGALDRLPDDLNARKNGIIVSETLTLDDALVRRISDFRFRGMKVLSYSAFYERYWSRIPAAHLSNTWFLQASGFDRIYDYVGLRLQRVVDVILSLTGIILLSPLLLLLVALVPLESKGKAIYKQKRVGLNGRVFTLYKFRSMVEDAEQNGPVWAQANDPRVTRLGRFLRTSRLDELPQLLNILKGEMSLIGPRPERPHFFNVLRKDVPLFELRTCVKPGITGWAQIRLPYASDSDEARAKLEYDLYYVMHRTLWFDLATLLETVRVVLTGAGAR